MGLRHTFSASDANALGLHLKAQAAFVLPESGGDSRLHARRGNLTAGIEARVVVGLSRDLGEREDILGTHGVGDVRRCALGRGEAIGVAVRLLLVLSSGRRVVGDVIRLQRRGLGIMRRHGSRRDGLRRGLLAGRHVLLIIHVWLLLVHGRVMVVAVVALVGVAC